MGWEELKGCSRIRAFKLIEIEHSLNKEQKLRLWRYWEQNKESLNVSYWSKPETWVVDKSCQKSQNKGK